ANYRIDRGVTEYHEWRLDRIVLPDGRFGVVCYFRDISEQVRVREALREADRRKDEFLATLAHELRNPLAPIRNGLQILRVARGNPQALELASGMMERQVGQLMRLIDDLLDVSRISHGKITLNKTRVELASVVYRSIETCRPVLDAMKHELTIVLPPPPVPIEADAVRLSQVLFNLLHNACKFTPQGGHIRLRVECDTRQSEQWVLISVRDDGIGIPAETLPRVFELFAQADRSLERSQGGLGIGLTLVRQLVELHQGTVEARSAGAGCGSEFIVHLPVGRDAAVSPPPEQRVSDVRRLPGVRNILIADDNRDSADSLAMLLASSGNVVRTAYDGQGAIDLAAADRPDIILLDIAMPKLNGYDTARQIRALPGGSSIVLIAMTGFGQQADRHRSKAVGFDGHLVKPVDYGAVMELLASVQARG
ncbi:MAG TPA: ATP-binding protein, partial [Steroidobacteraceae bacterium]